MLLQDVETTRKGPEKDPAWGELFQLLLVDTEAQGLEIELYDTNMVTGDTLVSPITTHAYTSPRVPSPGR